MIYPENFEQKVGFDKVRALLRECCLSTLGQEQVDAMFCSTEQAVVNAWMEQLKEMRGIRDRNEDFPMLFFFDLRGAIERVHPEHTHLEENELHDLRRSLETTAVLVRFLNQTDESGSTAYRYPALHRLADGVVLFPQLIRRADQIIDSEGRLKDDASPTLLQIRSELRATEASIARRLQNILKQAQNEGWVEPDVTPTLRDGRLVIPVAPSLKRRIGGIVHDTSSTGRTVFIEPAEVVEANNRIRELEREEQKEVTRILTEFTDLLRPHYFELLEGYNFLSRIDFVQAKAQMAQLFEAQELSVADVPQIDWTAARHPLLQRSLEKQGKATVPLTIRLTPDKRILMISGPNAGGKSVCLKTVALLQYMLQCGMSVPTGENSAAGLFQHIMIDIGDEQSIENDLSTYSSHLINMKQMMKTANARTLLLIDEFGSGTEPQIGGAMAEAILKKFCEKQSWAVVTTHYQNLKHFAKVHIGIANAAMLYDRQEMRPLFQLAIGQPGNSFAIEIARKTGIPESVIREASALVGSDYIRSDKYLQDIVRDKRYWENKRQAILQRQKDVEYAATRYEAEVKATEEKRSAILKEAREQAERLLAETNKRIENVIREIREQQAEKEATRRIREELKVFEQTVQADSAGNERGIMSDEEFRKKTKQIRQQKERKERRRNEKQMQKQLQEQAQQQAVSLQRDAEHIKSGDKVRIIGLSSVGRIESIDGSQATVIFGNMRSKIGLDRLEHAFDAARQSNESRKEALQVINISEKTRDTIDNRQQHFRPDLDIRGMRGEEAITAVQYFVDDAILIGTSRVRILHGKGNGILRQLVRQYLSTVANVIDYRDEHVQFGGAGITVVDLA